LSAALGETIQFFTATSATRYSVTFVRFRNVDVDEVTPEVVHQGQEIMEEAVVRLPILSNLPGYTRLPTGSSWDPSQPLNERWVDGGEPAFELVLPNGLRSGMYAAKCCETEGGEDVFYILFIVNPDPGRRANLLVLANVNTWNAYNPWGGYSRY